MQKIIVSLIFSALYPTSYVDGYAISDETSQLHDQFVPATMHLNYQADSNLKGLAIFEIGLTNLEV